MIKNENIVLCYSNSPPETFLKIVFVIFSISYSFRKFSSYMIVELIACLNNLTMYYNEY